LLYNKFSRKIYLQKNISSELEKFMDLALLMERNENFIGWRFNEFSGLFTNSVLILIL